MENLKEHGLRILLGLGLLLGIAVGAHAQSLVVAKIPFDFVVSGTKLPAGTYSIDRFLPENPDVLVVHDSDRKFSAFATASLGGDSQPSTAPKLIFHRYGEEYFLSEVRTLARVYPLATSGLEKKLAKTRDQDKVSIAGGH
jgi:hypothetical protein